MKTKFLLFIAIFVLFISQILKADEWYSAPSLHVPRGGAAAVTYGNHIYVFGGMSFNNKVLNNVERYDLIEGIWDTTFVPDFNYPRYNATAVVSSITLFIKHHASNSIILLDLFNGLSSSPPSVLISP